MNKCYICGSTSALQEHHIYPVQYGFAKTSPMITLCGGCHDRLHILASMVMSKNSKFKDQPFDTQQQFERAKPLVQCIINAKNIFETKPQSNEPRRKMITIQIGDADWVKFRKRQMDCGFSNISDFIVSLIKKEISNI